MNKSFFISLLACICFVGGAQGQAFSGSSISGRVLEGENSPLPFVSVLLKNSLDSAIIKSTLTDDLGTFTFMNVKTGNYFAEFKLLGYATVIKKDISISVGGASVKLGDILLTPSFKMLSEVVVKADIPFIERRADKIIVNLNEALTAGSSIMDLMGRLPGVTVSLQDQISLNGKSITIYIDGRITPLHGEALASFLKGMSSSNIEKVELITNPSSKYDAAGSGGIINIVRKRNTKEGLIGSAYGGFQQGRYGRHSGGITLNLKNKLYNAFLSTDYAYTKYFIDSKSFYDRFAADHFSLGQSQFNAYITRNNRVLTPNLGFDFYLSKKTTLSVSGSQSLTRHDKMASTLVIDSDENESLLSKQDLSNNAHTRSNTTITNIHLLHKLDSSGKEITADFDYSIYGNNSDLNNSDKIYGATGNYISSRNSLLDQDGEISMYAIKIDYTNPINKTSNLELGLKSGYVDSDNSNLFYNVANNIISPDQSRTDNFKYAENINALYLNFNRKYTKLSFQLGLRGEHTLGKGVQLQTQQKFTNQYVKAFPSVSLDYKLNSNHGLTLNFNKRISRPNYENLNPLLRVINSTLYTGGNPGLRPTLSYNSSLSYSFKNEFFAHLHYDVGLRELITVTSPDSGTSAFISRPGNNNYSNYLRAFLVYSKRLKSWWMSSNSMQLFQQQYKSLVNGYQLNSKGIPASEITSYQEFNASKRLTLMVMLRYQSKFESRNRTTDENYYMTGGFKLKLFGEKGSFSVHLTDIFETYTNRYTENSVLVNQTWDNYYDTRILYTNFSYNFGKGRVKNVNKGSASEEERKRTSVKEN